MHHSDPTCARHGVDRFQFDSSARLIRVFEKFGWATDVRWPDARRLAAPPQRQAPDQPQPVLQAAER